PRPVGSPPHAVSADPYAPWPCARPPSQRANRNSLGANEIGRVMNRRYSLIIRVATGILAAALLATCRENQGPESSTDATPSPPPSFATSSGPATLVGAGDIADCTRNGDSLTANLLDTIPGTVFLAGDNAYPSGSSTDYANCYGPTWGRHKARTRPAPGNHEYSTSGAAGYFGYFGTAAGDPTKGYYSYELGDWHIIVLNGYHV